MKKLLSLTGVFMLTAVAAFAGDGKTFDKKVIVPVETCYFRANEFQLDAFGVASWATGQNPGWGGGVGMNYFFTKFVGIGVEQDVIGRRGEKAEWVTAGHLFVRYPICSINLAPYIMVGGGAGYGSHREGHGFGDVGGGLEYRFTPNIGIFTDARFVYSSEEPKTGVLGRTGVRFAF
ncbi:MAG: hypothetical protein WCQ16_11380 [Verrucomicrobiae bacterium]